MKIVQCYLQEIRCLLGSWCRQIERYAFEGDGQLEVRPDRAVEDEADVHHCSDEGRRQSAVRVPNGAPCRSG